MRRRSKLIFAAVLLAPAVLVACSKSGSTGPAAQVALTWSGAVHSCGAPPVLTATQLLGPSGSSIGHILPGVYTARGTYTLPASGAYIITLGFNGSYVTAFGGTVGQDHDQTILAGSLTGTFEVTQEVLEWTSGPGHVIVDIFPGTAVAGSAADCLELS